MAIPPPPPPGQILNAALTKVNNEPDIYTSCVSAHVSDVSDLLVVSMCMASVLILVLVTTLYVQKKKMFSSAGRFFFLSEWGK